VITKRLPSVFLFGMPAARPLLMTSCAVLLSAQLSGCFGVAVYYASTFEFPNHGDASVYPEWDAATELPVRVVEKNLGAPDKVQAVDATTQRWVYRGPLRVCGVYAVLVLVPIPLILPLGCETTAFLVRDGRVVSTSFVREVENASICGYILGPCPYWGVRRAVSWQPFPDLRWPRHPDDPVLQPSYGPASSE
jgi:hypothetical protein